MIQPSGTIRKPILVALVVAAVDVFLHQESWQIQGYGVIVVIHTICLNIIAIVVCLPTECQSQIFEVVWSRSIIVSDLFIAAVELIGHRSIDRSDIKSVIVRGRVIRIAVESQEVVQRLRNQRVM